MPKPSLYMFLADPKMKDAWLSEPEWSSIYVRKSFRAIQIGGPEDDNEGVEIVPCIDLANITAKKPGKGAFTRLVRWLHNQLQKNIYVESVFDERFGKYLESLGFYRMPVFEGPQCYLLRGISLFRDPGATQCQ